MTLGEFRRITAGLSDDEPIVVSVIGSDVTYTSIATWTRGERPLIEMVVTK